MAYIKRRGSGSKPNSQNKKILKPAATSSVRQYTGSKIFDDQIYVHT